MSPSLETDPRRPPRWSALPVGPWRWWYALIGVAAALGLLFALVMLRWGGVWGQVAQFLGFMLLAVAVPWVLSRRASAADWGWLPGRPWRTALVVVVLTLTLQVMVQVFEALAPSTAQAASTVLRSFGFGRDTAFDVALVLCIVMLAPLGEEMLFRGLIYRSLRDGLARHLPIGLAIAVGVALSAAGFAFAHGGEGQEQQLWQLIGVGLVLVLAYELTGSITAPIMVHSLNNTLALAAGLARHPDVRLAQPWIETLAWMGPLLTLLLIGGLSALWRRR